MMETDDIVLEHLRAIRREMALMADDIRALRAENTAFRHQVTAMSSLPDYDHGDVAQLKDRVDRIERRLDLVE